MTAFITGMFFPGEKIYQNIPFRTILFAGKIEISLSIVVCVYLRV